MTVAFVAPNARFATAIEMQKYFLKTATLRKILFLIHINQTS